MLKQDPYPSGDRGWIINLASIMGFVASTGTSAYCASKGAVIQMTKSIALDYGSHGMLVAHILSLCSLFVVSPLEALTLVL